jgi:hypothetical protein
VAIDGERVTVPNNDKYYIYYDVMTESQDSGVRRGSCCSAMASKHIRNG